MAAPPDSCDWSSGSSPLLAEEFIFFDRNMDAADGKKLPERFFFHTAIQPKIWC